jgi:hypothetical protein
VAERLPASWDELGEASAAGTVYPGPRRAIDGLVASTLDRPVWSLAVDRLRVAGHLDVVLDVALWSGKRCVAMPSLGFATAVEVVDAADFSELGTVLELPMAVITHVGVEAHDDGEMALRAGIRPILVGVMTMARGTLVVSSPEELVGLMCGAATIAATSTYHEA